MQLQVLRDRLEVLAERDIPDPAFLLAAAEVIREIEAYDYRLVERSSGSMPLVTAQTTYDLSSIDTGISRTSLLDLWLQGERAKPRRLLPVDEAVASVAAPTVPPMLYYYTFTDLSEVQLNAEPTEGGNLVAFWRTYDLDSLALTTDVSYPPLLSGVLSWLGRSIWEDSRQEVWQANYTKQLKDFAARFQLRGSYIGNMLDRLPPAGRSSYRIQG